MSHSINFRTQGLVTWQPSLANALAASATVRGGIGTYPPGPRHAFLGDLLAKERPCLLSRAPLCFLLPFFLSLLASGFISYR